MHTLAICGSDIASRNPDNPTISTLEVAGVPVTVGLMSLAPPEFDPSADTDRRSVVVETTAFSCNYRDKALALRAGP